MAKIYTADEIISLARDIGKLPNTSATGTSSSDLLGFLNGYLQTTLAPAILNSREDYFNRSKRTALAASTSAYRIDPRAMLGVERDITYINTSGKRYPVLQKISRGDVDQVQDSLSATRPTGFYLEGNYIHLVPTLGASAEGYLEETFPMRPGELVLAEDARLVQSVNTTTRVVTLTASAPSNWSAASTFDVHSPYSGAELKCWGKAASTVAGSQITFSTAIDGSLTGEYAIEAGDYVCLAGESAVPAVPYEFHPILAQATAHEFVASLGDAENARMLKGRLDEMMRVTLDALRPRVEGKREAIKRAPYISLQGRRGALYG